MEQFIIHLQIAVHDDLTYDVKDMETEEVVEGLTYPEVEQLLMDQLAI